MSNTNPTNHGKAAFFSINFCNNVVLMYFGFSHKNVPIVKNFISMMHSVVMIKHPEAMVSV